jgi:hypothetical protein
MRYKGLRIVITLIFMASAMTALARQSANDKPVDKTAVSKMPSQRPAPKVSTEFGLGVGARYNWFSVQTPAGIPFTPKITMPLSYGAALQFRLNIGRSFGIQPEISYAHSVVRINDKATNNFSTKAKSNIVQIPLLLSFRIAMFRINFGPVFTLMDNATYQLANTVDESIKQMQLGRIHPAVTYTAGISVKFARCMMLDVRYADQFPESKDRVEELIKKEKYWRNAYVWTLDSAKQPEAQYFRTNTRSVQVRIGYVF